MPTCANCSEVAVYTYPVSEGYNIHYCATHLPRFLFPRRDAGLIPVIAVTPPVEELSAPKSKKTVVVEPVSEDAVN